MGKYKFIEERVETMSSSELKIFLNILKSRSKELMSTLESVRGIKDLEAVCKSTQKLNNRVSEFDGGSFLILVVGPVKSGKSTLVNLIAHAHVSPTHFLECTVRPSIISKGQGQAKSGSLRDIQPANAYHTIRSYPKSQAYSCHSEHSVYLQTESATK